MTPQPAPSTPSSFESDLAEVQAVLWGDNIRRDNGVRGDLRRVERDVEKLKVDVVEGVAMGKRYFDVERPANCIGKAEVVKLREELEKKERLQEVAMVEMKKTRLAMMGSVLVALLTMAGSIWQTSITQTTAKEIAAMRYERAPIMEEVK